METKSNVGSHPLFTLQRSIGALAAMTRSGPAKQKSTLYQLLKAVGVLETMPHTWEESDLLQSMPWGAQPVDAPPPIQPAGFDGMWPQEPVINAQFSAPTLNLDRDERQPHRIYNVTRYLGQILCLSPLAAWRATFGTRLAPVDEKTFRWILTETSFGQYINPTLDPIDEQRFAPIIGADDLSRYAKVDCSGMGEDGTSLPGIYVAPTVTLLRRENDGTYTVAAIWVGDERFTPDDGAAWALAKYFVLQGIQVLQVLIMHPRIHFPCDAINTITQMTLPRGHLLYKLLIPHTTYTLGLHEAVIHHRRSIFHNSQREVYTPFPQPTDAIHKGMVWGLHGIEGNSSYLPYEFGCELIGTHTPYGRFRQAWFEHILALTTRITSQIPKHDPYVTQWADHIHQWVPGFPNGHEIFTQDRLAWAAALFMANVSVFHTGDHHSYSRIPLKYMPFRLRQPGPHVQRPDTLDLNQLVSREDSFRHQLSHAMFFKPTVLANLADVRYYFRDEKLKRAERDFIAGMDGLDQRWRATTFPASQEIAASLQY